MSSKPVTARSPGTRTPRRLSSDRTETASSSSPTAHAVQTRGAGQQCLDRLRAGRLLEAQPPGGLASTPSCSRAPAGSRRTARSRRGSRRVAEEDQPPAPVVEQVRGELLGASVVLHERPASQPGDGLRATTTVGVPRHTARDESRPAPVPLASTTPVDPGQQPAYRRFESDRGRPRSWITTDWP